MKNPITPYTRWLMRQKARLDAWAHRRHMPYGDGVTLYEFAIVLAERMQRSAFDLRAFAIAFNFFLAFFPTLLVLIMFLPFLPVPELEQRLIGAITDALPENAHDLVSHTVRSTFADSDLGLLLLTAATTIFFASRGVRYLMRAFKDRSDHHVNRSIIHEYALAIAIYLGLLLIGLVGGAAFIAADWLTHSLVTHKPWLDWLIHIGLQFLRGALTLTVIFTALSFIYRAAPNLSRRFHFFSLGGFVGAILLYISQYLLQVYFKNFTNYNKLFGSLTAVMVLMVWFYWISVAILIGYEINVSLRRAKLMREMRRASVSDS